MSDPITDLKRELLAAAERERDRTVPAGTSRRRWLGTPQSGRRWRLVVAAAAAFVAVVGTTIAIGAVDDFTLPFATPSGPQSGELVAEWKGRSVTLAPHGPGLPLVRTYVYADGRIIWDREGWIPEGASMRRARGGQRVFVQQRLTSEGVELLRSELTATGLFDRSVTLVLPPDVHGWGKAEVRNGGQLVRLLWHPAELRWSDGETPTAEQVSALRRVDALLSNPASVLPSSAWADREIRAYVPAQYAACLMTSPPKDVSRLLSLLPARAEELLRDESWSESEVDVIEGLEGGRTKVLGRSASYCAKVEPDEVRDVVAALPGANREQMMRQQGLYTLAEGTKIWEGTRISFHPYLPHGEIPLPGS
jgi:hypothetical protein